MNGELVIIRAHQGHPLIRRIYRVDNNAVYVTDDSMEDIVSIGFPREDVFQYNHELAEKLNKLYKNNKLNWNELILY